MLLSKWNDVEEWINTNGFKRVVVRANDKLAAGEDVKYNDVLFDSKNVSADWNTKMEHLRWTMEHCDRKAYATGFQSESAGTGGMIAEIRLEAAAPVPAQMSVGFAPVGQVDEQAIIERVRKEVRAEFERNELDRERKAFEQERKEFNEVKNGVMGLVVGYGKPILDALTAKRTVVAGIDQPGNTDADPIGREGDGQDSPFSDIEADELFDLMARFKAVEPEYMKLIRSVVTMAESGDGMYAMARGVLVK